VPYGLVRLLSAVLITGTLPAFCQSSPPIHSATPVYLLRIQRTTPEAVNCLLLRNDGEFHLETSHRDETKVFEGLLPNASLQKVQRMLDNSDLQRLSQIQSNAPGKTEASEILQVSIFRTDHWQNLVYVTDNAGQRLPQSLAPLADWLNALHKEPHRQLSEDEHKNNCQSPAKIELKRRP
jgi:hypothetical protein